jgi:hypothetical protein
VDHNLRQRSLESVYFKSHCGSMIGGHILTADRWGQVLVFECLHVQNMVIQGVF